MAISIEAEKVSKNSSVGHDILRKKQEQKLPNLVKISTVGTIVNILDTEYFPL